jgi:hypothetical protein
MSITDIAYYASFVLTGSLIGVLWWAAWKQKGVFQNRNKSRILAFTIAASAAGFASSFFGFWAIVSLLSLFGFNANLGHGEVIIAAFVFNLILALMLTLIGRIVLAWEIFRF